MKAKEKFDNCSKVRDIIWENAGKLKNIPIILISAYFILSKIYLKLNK